MTYWRARCDDPSHPRWTGPVRDDWDAVQADKTQHDGTRHGGDEFAQIEEVEEPTRRPPSGTVRFADMVEEPPLPPGLSFRDKLDPSQRYGVKLAETNGTYYWQPATEEDYRNSEAERLGVALADVRLLNCESTHVAFCDGLCAPRRGEPKTWCQSLWNPREKYAYCACVE